MTGFNPTESLNARFTKLEHSDPDLHYIGEAIAIPSSVSRTGTAGSVGISKFPAREDHIHSFGVPPAVELTKSTNQLISNVTSTVVTFETEKYDEFTMHTGSEGKITIPTGLSGFWLCGYDVYFQAATAGGTYRQSYMRINGTGSEMWGGRIKQPDSSAIGQLQGGSRLLRLNAADYVEVIVYQNSGGSLNIHGDDTVVACTSFWAVRLGPTT